MKVFISYSHEDRAIVERLAQDLRIYGFDVWIDFWSMRAGDSLLTRIGQGITEAAFFLVALSKTSVASDWVNRELEVALQRELAEKRVVVIPLRLEDVVIPPFLTPKMYANFSTDYEVGLKETVEALRPGYDVLHVDAPEFHVDYAVDSDSKDGEPSWRIVFSDHGPSDYVVVGTITLTGESHLKRRFAEYSDAGLAEVLTPIVLDMIATAVEAGQARLSLFGVTPQKFGFRLGAKGEEGEERVTLEIRRLGGRIDEDIVVHLGKILRMLADHQRAVSTSALGADARRRYVEFLKARGTLKTG